MFFHLFYVLSLAVFLFQIYAKKKILRPSCVTIVLSSGSWFPWILVLSLFLLWLVLRVLKLLLLELDQAALLLLASRVPILEAARQPLPGLN